MTDLAYICQWCGKQGMGMKDFYFVTGALDGIFCRLWCLVDAVAKQNEVEIDESYLDKKWYHE